jgi:integrase
MLKHLFSKCITWKSAKSTPMKDVKLYKESNNRVRYLTDKEARRLLAACNKDFRIVALTAMLTGLRCNERDHCDGRMRISKTIQSQLSLQIGQLSLQIAKIVRLDQCRCIRI